MVTGLVRRYARPMAGVLGAAGVAGFAEAIVLVTLVPLATTIAAGDDRFTGSFAGIELSIELRWLFLAAVGLILLRLAAQSLETWLVARLVARYELEERVELFSAFVDSEWPVQAESRAGHLQDLLTSYLQRTMNAFEQLCTSLSSLVNLVALLAIAFAVNPLVVLLVVVTSSAIFFAVRPISTISARVSRKQRVLSLRLAGEVHGAVLMSREIRIFNAGEAFKLRMRSMLAKNARNRRVQRFLTEGSSIAYQAIVLLMVIAGLAAVWVLDYDDLGSLAAIVLLLMRALTAAQGFQRPYLRFRENQPFFESLATEKERLRASPQQTGGDAVDEVESIAFDDVSFVYPGNDAPALREVSFGARQGETVGIVGPSGAGKSTFVQLLLQLRRPTTGEVMVNGRPGHELSLPSIYAQIGYVPQEPLLLDASVEANIRFFRPEIEMADVERAARLAHVHDEIMALPEGYATSVGERGSSVSGGQRQRICIARALVTGPGVLVLDEPTSALDGHSEQLVQQTLEAVKSEMLVFIVAHRLTTLSGCDKVMVFEEGRLTAYGPPSELREASAYFDTAMRQAQV